MPLSSPTRLTSTTSSSLTGSYRSTLSSSSNLDKPFYRSTSGTYATSMLRNSTGDQNTDRLRYSVSLTGPYRPALSSSNLDKPYNRSTRGISSGDRTEYKSTYSIDDVKKKNSLAEYSRNSQAPSISGRYRTDRSESRSRDITTTRETTEMRKRNLVGSSTVSKAELYSKYSPANYIPLTQRIQQQKSHEEISRSRSISNDIGPMRRTINAQARILEEPRNTRKYASSSTIAMSAAQLYDKYSPAKYIPLTQRIQQKSHEEISRSKSISNDIERPPLAGNPLTKTLSSAKPLVENNNSTTSHAAKLPSERLASIKSQLNPNNPKQKILEKSTVVQVEKCDTKNLRNSPVKSKNIPEVEIRSSLETNTKDAAKNEIKRRVETSKRTSNFASYIQIGTSSLKNKLKIITHTKNDLNAEPRKSKVNAEQDFTAILEEKYIESPKITSIEMKTFEYENSLKKHTEMVEEKVEEVKSMEKSTEDTTSEPAEDSNPGTPSARRILDLKDYEEPKRPSSPAPVFEGTFNATDDSSACPQTDGQLSHGSLDCLHLNVFVPSSATNLLPVLLFIHGGAFEEGAHGRYMYGPKFLIRHDIILVTLNYRLSVFGFMCTDSARVPGNQAFRDQLLALKWVHENVENFGGDPNKVTLSGVSAGAMATDLQIISDNSPKLFQQAILQSGVSFLPSYPSTLRNSPLILAQHFDFQTADIDEALDFLATIDPLQIITVVHQLGLQFRPCIERSFDGIEPFLTDNWVLKDQIPAAKNLKMLMGFNENEALGLFLTPESDLSNIVNESLMQIFSIDHEDFVGISEVRHFFFGDEDIDSTKFKDAINLRSDNPFVYASMRSVRRFLKNDVEKLYLYLFSYDGERNIVKNNVNTTLEGAAHADELGYLYDVSYLGQPSAEDQLTIDRMTEMWANFVKYGDPTPTLTPLLPVKWKSITPTSAYHYMHIDADLEANTSPFNERMAFWDLFLEANADLQKFVLDNADI